MSKQLSRSLDGFLASKLLVLHNGSSKMALSDSLTPEISMFSQFVETALLQDFPVNKPLFLITKYVSRAISVDCFS